jgi:glycosyltransferase involved in cell wall biosynthesis
LDVHVLSSSGEAFPNVLCEAMACETPVITTNVGDAAIIVGEKGWVVHSKDPQALASAMLDAQVTFHDSERWNSLKRSSRERVQNHFSLSKMILNYSQVWKTLL